MQIIDSHLLDDALSQNGLTIKFLLNDHAIAFFSASKQHRDVKVAGLTYEDDSKGNAVAGVITPEHVEIRFHQGFSETHIHSIWKHLITIELVKLGARKAFYQGREIHLQ